MIFNLGEEKVIVRGIRPEEQLWGAYQFPRPYKVGNKIIVSVHVEQDTIKNFGNPQRWFESVDNGESWTEISPLEASKCGLLLNNGDRIYFPSESGISLSEYVETPWYMRTPAYDMNAKAPDNTLPLPNGFTIWLDGTKINAYLAERMPGEYSKKEWTMIRIPAGQDTQVVEKVPIEWKSLTRVVYFGDKYDKVLKPIFPRGNLKIGPDGAIWISAFSGEGHIDPETGEYSPYYSAELFRSDDNAKSFKQRSHMEYRADGADFPYQSGGFSDSDFEFMADGSIIWIFRSAWAMSTGIEWAPMYISRSTDLGYTWSKPKKFSNVGVLPRLCSLDCGVTLVCYGRPGIFVRGCDDGRGLSWSEPLEIMTPKDRSHLANVVSKEPSFHDWDGGCNNPEIIPIGKNSALIFYSDFYYPDDSGVKRKTILCRKITVEK